MPKKPQDMLEFLRRNKEELARATPSPPLPQGKPKARPTKRAEAPDAPERPGRPPGKPPGKAGKTRPEASPAAPSGPGRLLALPRSRVWMVAGGAALLLLLVFWIGTKVGGNGENPDNARFATPGGQAPFWTVRVIGLNLDEQARAESVVKAIADHRASRGLPELELKTWTLERSGKLVVTIGRWPVDPKDDAQAREVLDYIRRLENKETGRPLFTDAYFWQTPR